MKEHAIGPSHNVALGENNGMVAGNTSEEIKDIGGSIGSETNVWAPTNGKRDFERF